MSLWIGNTEVGLAPGQTAGNVGGTYVVRDPSSDISKPYIEATSIESLTVPTGGYKVIVGGKTFYTKEVPEIGYYRPEAGYRSVRRTDIPSKEEIEEQYKQQVASGQIIPNLAAYKKEAIKLEAARKSLLEQGYKPYVTIEGTTLYTKGTQQKEITVPKYGKMVQRGERTEPFLGVFTPDKFTDQVDDTQRKISLQIERLDKEISEKYGLPEIVEPAVKTFRHAQFLAEREEKYKKLGGGQSELGKAGSEFAIGFVEEAAQKPITATGNALFALFVTKGIGGLASKAPILTHGIGTGKIARNVNAVNILGTSLAGMYGYDVTTRAIAAENKARFAGQVTATEILPFAVGGYIGTKKIPSIPTKEITRRAEISYLKMVREGRILQAKTSRDFEQFIFDESAELAKRRKRAVETIVSHKPEVAKKAEAVEVIRADIALEKQLKAEAKIKQISISSPKTRHEFKQISKTMQEPRTKQLPIFATINIQNAESILKPEARAISIQAPVAIQEPISALRYKPIQEAKAIQEAKTVQIAEAILKAEIKQKNIQKAKEILKSKPKLELPVKKILPPKKPKEFIDAINERYKQKRKSKWVWDVNNPVPTLEEVIS